MSLWDTAMNYASENPMQTAGLGLSGFSDIMGAYSRMQAEQRQRELYNNLRDPSKLMSLYQPMSAAGQSAVNRDINANLASRGIADGGAGTQFAADAWAKLENDRQQAAVSQYIRAMTGAGSNVGMPAGGGNATANMMQNIMMWKAIQDRQRPDGQAFNGGTYTGNLMGAGGGNMTPNYDMRNSYALSQGGGMYDWMKPTQQAPIDLNVGNLGLTSNY